jgi:molybdenum cofactor cytidylyltransferase
MVMTENRIAGILLAAGKGKRFDPHGKENKLMQPLDSGAWLAMASARSLLTVLPHTLAVVRPDNQALAFALQSIGCDVIECADADQGMAASLVHGLMQVKESDGWIIALADMPYVQSATSQALVEALAHGADIAVPVYQGQRGNPVGFRRTHLPRLLRLRGDQGARGLLRTWPVTEVAVDDAGILCDIDTKADLR